MSSVRATSAPSSAGQVLAGTRALVDPALRATVAGLSEPTRLICSYHFGWCDPEGHLSNSRVGKAVRPALALTCARAVGAAPETAVPAAVTVELVHNFTLVHDDILDADHLRRGRPTAWSVFGIPAAMLAGDALLALAVEMLACYPPPQAAAAAGLLGSSLVEVVNGQSADVAFEHQQQVSLAEAVAMAEGKTASLLGCACALGATAGGAETARVRLLQRMGHHLGLAFQLVDDLLGIWGDPVATGKPVRADLRRGKKTLPVVAAVASGTDAGRRLAQLYLRPEPLSETELDTATGLIERAGGRCWAQDEADRHLTAALTCLQDAEPTPDAASDLVALAQLISHRDH